MPDILLKNASGEDVTYENVNAVNLRNTDGGTETFVSNNLIQNQVQADWNQTDETAVDFIKNKPETFETEAELPEVTEADNGKVLGVVNGLWSKMNAPSGSGSGSSGASSVQPNWNQNDSTQADYIKNRPFYIGDETSTTLLPAMDLEFNPEDSYMPYIFMTPVPSELIQLWLEDWNSATITWDGTEYICEPKSLYGIKAIGNVELMLGTGDSGEPFLIGCMQEDGNNICIAYSLTDIPNIILDASLSYTAVEDTSYYYASIDPLTLIEGEQYLLDGSLGTIYNLVATKYTLNDTTYIGIGNPSILGLSESSSSDNFFIYTATTSDGTQSSAMVVTFNPNDYTYTIRLCHTPIVTHNVSGSIKIQQINTIDPKFLREVPWDKISDKPFYEIASGMLISEGTVSCNTEFEANLYYTTVDEVDLIANVQYAVTWDNTTYYLTAQGEDEVMLSEPNNIFMIVNGYIDGSTMILGSQGAHTYTITTNEETVKKLDAKFLPDNIGGGLPEYSSSGTDDGKVLKINGSTPTWQTPDSGLPIVDNSSNNKVLKVVGGAWAVADETENPKELPAVNTDNNGQVLTVSDGIWTPMDPITELPKATTDDNDKVLKVVGGAWAIATETKELPQVTANDNNRVLKVVDNTWTVAEESKELPSISDTDNGKFLRVMNGAPVWATVQNVTEVQF